MKICSLLPSATEILFALGLGDQVIGVSDLCSYPPEAQDKTVICRSRIDTSLLSSDQVEKEMRGILATGESPYELDEAWIWRESPDVVLTQDLCYFCEVDAATVAEAVLGMLAQPQVVVLQPKTMAEIFDTIRQIGEACNVVDTATALMEALRGRVKLVEHALTSVERRPRVFSLEGINPIVIGGHWIPELLELAGGSQGPYPPGSPACRPSWAEICNYAPEKLYIDLCSSDLARGLREMPWLATLDGWSEIPAVQAGEVYLIDHVYFSNPGPRVVNGLEILAQLTHPQLFQGQIAPDTVLKLDPVLAKGCPSGDIAGCFRPYPLPPGQ